MGLDHRRHHFPVVQYGDRDGVAKDEKHNHAGEKTDDSKSRYPLTRDSRSFALDRNRQFAHAFSAAPDYSRGHCLALLFLNRARIVSTAQMPSMIPANLTLNTRLLLSGIQRPNGWICPACDRSS